MIRICFLALLVGVCTSGRAAIIQFSDFSSTEALQLNGEAAAVSTTEGWVLRLTPSDPSLKRGSAFWKDAVDVTAFRNFSRSASAPPTSVRWTPLGSGGPTDLLSWFNPALMGQPVWALPAMDLGTRVFSQVPPSNSTSGRT